MRLMRKHDPQLREDGFHTLLPVAGEHVTELIDEFNAERDDHGLRCWLLELIGEARSPLAFQTVGRTTPQHRRVVQLVGRPRPGKLDTKEARRLLWQWSHNQTPRQPE